MRIHMGSLEQKQTVEWTLLKVGVKRWSFVRCFTMKKQLFVHQNILIVSEVWKGNANTGSGEFSSAAFLYCNGVTESQ